jgi:hypothetical protein
VLPAWIIRTAMWIIKVHGATTPWIIHTAAWIVHVWGGIAVWIAHVCRAITVWIEHGRMGYPHFRGKCQLEQLPTCVRVCDAIVAWIVRTGRGN